MKNAKFAKSGIEKCQLAALFVNKLIGINRGKIRDVSGRGFVGLGPGRALYLGLGPGLKKSGSGRARAHIIKLLLLKKVKNPCRISVFFTLLLFKVLK